MHNWKMNMHNYNAFIRKSIFDMIKLNMVTINPSNNGKIHQLMITTVIAANYARRIEADKTQNST